MSALCPHCSAELEPSASRCTRCDSALDPLFPAGERIDERFEILSALAVGPLGATYRVRDVTDGVEVALTLLAEPLCPTASDRSGFVSRMEVMVGRTIAGCAMPLAVGECSLGAYLTSPIIDGVRLRSVLLGRRAQNRPLRLEESLRTLLSLSASLSALHSVTPHGALSVDTVMITTRGLILIDGAVAVALPPDRLQPRLQTFAYSAPYMPPEATRGKRLNALADLYALGAIAAECVAGEPTLAALDRAKLDLAIDSPIRWLLDPDPTGRPAALAAMLDSLSAASGFTKRPSPGPLPVPEIPAPPRYSVPPSALAELGAMPPPPISRPSRETVVTVATRMPRPSTPPSPSPQPTAPMPPTASVAPRAPSIPAPRVPSMAPGTARRSSPDGRISPSTASVPVASRVLGSSGPPGGLEQSRSGPPSHRPPPPPEPEESDIDPRLLRAAQRLDAERQAGDHEEIDSNEIEVIED